LSAVERNHGHGDGSESVRDILRHSWIYSLAPVFQRLLAIVLIRLYTSRLSPGEYGVIELIDVLLMLVPQIVGINLLGGLTRFYFEHADPRRRAQVVTSTTIALCGSALVLCAAALFLREPLAGIFFADGGNGSAPKELVDAFTIAILIVPFSLCTTSALRYLQVLKWSRTSTVIQMGKTVLEAGLKLWMLFGLEWGVAGFLLSILIGEAVASIALGTWMFLRLRTGFDWAVFRPLFLFALPLLPLGIVQLGLHYFGRVVLEHAGPQTLVHHAGGALDATLAREWVGVFGLGYKIASLVHSAALVSFMQIWQPYVFALPEATRRGELVRLGNWAIAALAAVYLGLAIFGRQAVDLLSGDEAFRAAWRVTPIVALAYLAYASYSISQVALLATKRTWALLGVNVAALAIGVAVAWGLVSRAEAHGYTAAAVGTLAAFAPLALCGEWLARAGGASTRSTGAALRLFAIASVTVGVALCIDAWRDPLAHGALLPVLGLKAILAALMLFSLWRFAIDGEGRAGLVRLGRDLVAKWR